MTEIQQLQDRIKALESALAPFAKFANAFAAKPLGQFSEEMYSIHAGTKFEASLYLSDCKAAAALLGSRNVAPNSAKV